MCRLQEKIFEDFGYFYDRKRGEFHDGLSMKYINKAQIIDRSVFLRIAAGVTGDASKARKTSDEYLFRWESFHELIQDKSMYRKFMYGYFCHQFLEKLEKSVGYSEGMVHFTVPEEYDSSWYIQLLTAMHCAMVNMLWFASSAGHLSWILIWQNISPMLNFIRNRY